MHSRVSMTRISKSRKLEFFSRHPECFLDEFEISTAQKIRKSIIPLRFELSRLYNI